MWVEIVSQRGEGLSLIMYGGSQRINGYVLAWPWLFATFWKEAGLFSVSNTLCEHECERLLMQV